MASCLLANQSSHCRIHSQHLPKRLLEGMQSFCEALGACCTRPPQEAPSPAIRRVLCYSERERPGRGSRRTKTNPRRRPPASASVHAPAPAHTLVRGPSATRLIGTARFALQWSSPAVARAASQRTRSSAEMRLTPVRRWPGCAHCAGARVVKLFSKENVCDTRLSRPTCDCIEEGTAYLVIRHCGYNGLPRIFAPWPRACRPRSGGKGRRIRRVAPTRGVCIRSRAHKISRP